MRTSVFFPGRYTLSQSSLTSREECNVFAGLFFLEFIYVFGEILSTSMFFCCSIYIDTAQNSREECNEFADRLFWRLSLRLSRDSVLWHSLIRSLRFIQVYIFIPPIHSAPFLRFSHILLYTNIFWCILPREIYFLSLMSAVAREFNYYF